MSKNTFVAGALIVVVAGAAAGGYWLGQRPAATAPAAVQAKAAPKILYYRNPMGQPDTSPVPKKDEMGMDYIPVYEGEAGAADDGLKISAERIQRLGVRTEAAAMRQLEGALRAVGRVEIDERRVHAVAPRFEGWVERLHVNAGGQPVARGQVLFDVYSPELVSAQREYALAAKGVATLGDAESKKAMGQVAEAALARLRNWEISDEQIRALAGGGEARRTLSFKAPVGGIVLEKKALQGMRFGAGETLFQIADLGSVWVIADVPEQDIAAVKVSAGATVTLTAYPDKRFAGRVAYIYPTLKPETRTVPVRVELANPGGLLKPAMYAQVELASSKRGAVLAVPQAAVIDSGLRQVVIVQSGEGRFAPREVKLGSRDATYVEVLSGLKDGEVVVSAANFLLDAESNLRAALRGMESSTPAPQATPVPEHQHAPEPKPEPKPAAKAAATHDHAAPAAAAPVQDHGKH